MNKQQSLKQLAAGLKAVAAKTATLAWDESKYKRGKTTPGSRGGSFAPSPLSAAEANEYHSAKAREHNQLKIESAIQLNKSLHAEAARLHISAAAAATYKDSGRGYDANTYVALKSEAERATTKALTTEHGAFVGTVRRGDGKLVKVTVPPNEKRKNLSQGLRSLAERTRALADADGVWRTVRGRKIFIKNGESLDDALKRDPGKNAKSPDLKSVVADAESASAVAEKAGTADAHKAAASAHHKAALAHRAKRIGAPVGGDQEYGWSEGGKRTKGEQHHDARAQYHAGKSRNGAGR